MKNLERPPVSNNLLDLMTRVDKNGRSIFYQLDDNQLVRDINEEYLYWDKVKYKVPVNLQEFISPDELWQLVKRERRANQKVIDIANQRFFFTANDTLYEHLHQFDLHLGGSLGGQETLSDSDKHQYLIGSIMEESIASSQIEGAVTSRLVAKEMLRKDRPPRNTSERMIFNNYKTIQHIVTTKHQLLTPELLLDLHRLVTANTMGNPEEAGQLRKHDEIYVIDAVDGNVIHIPPAHTMLPGFTRDLCRFFNDESPGFFMHPVVKASIIHFLIGYFHPFTDGNGRTARALFYWYLLRKGYWLTEYLSISRVIMRSRVQYYKAFQYSEVDGNDLTYFVLYQTKTLGQAYDELKEYITRKIAEKHQLIAWQQSDGLSPRQAQIVGWFQQAPGITISIKEVETRLGISNQTARNDIHALIQAGYLTELAINRKERHYIQGSSFGKHR